MDRLLIQLRTLTPLWTGGVDQTCDRLHETGLIGSLRWWYEALVRGLGGCACDPTSEHPEARCIFDSKAYEKAKSEGQSEENALKAGLKTVCPVCYLFGATGWARLFQLRAITVPTTPLHFRTTLPMNKGWLVRVFGGEKRNIDSLEVPYGDLTFQLVPRRYYEEYVKSQIALILFLAANYSGIGARLQYGFGQFLFPEELQGFNFQDGLEQLSEKIQQGFLRSDAPPIETPYNLSHFVSLMFEVDRDALDAFMQQRAHVGASQKQNEDRYIPCVFDLRYKSSGDFGMREWLKNKGWRETDDPQRLEELDLLLGPRSQWGSGKSQRRIDENFRSASRVFFGMPYKNPEREDANKYILRAWAFWSPELSRLTGVDALKDLLQNYIHYAFRSRANLVSSALGRDILMQEA